MSAATTWMPLYIGDYLADTMHLSAEEHGAYLLLIMHYWKTGCPIKNDATVIQNIARIKPSRVSKDIVSTVSSFFEVRDGYLYHARIESEMAKAIEKKEKKIKQTAGARAAKADSPPPVTAPVTEIVTDNVTALHAETPSPSQLPSKSSDTNVSGEVPIDFKKIIFDEGLKFLAQRTGKEEKQLRPMLGKWCSLWGDSATAAALMDAQKFAAVDPISFIESKLKPKQKGRFAEQDYTEGTDGFVVN